jgi:nitroimidazol reductase NimA-like FMN-containing flavoprotein (pyridoxamine 5'-phosphate oxidase superfamily)
MSDAELDDFLGRERTCRVATSGPSGPHVTPLWFIWHQRSIWMSSLTRSQRWTDLAADPRISLVVDAGETYADLRGVEITGRADVVGEVPRTGLAHAQLDVVEGMFAEKYPGPSAAYDNRHAWLRVVPDKIVSWDMRKSAP